MDFDFFDFDGILVEELYELLDRNLAVLKTQMDPNRPEEFGGFETMEHIYAVAVVAAQRYIKSTCKSFEMNVDVAIKLGPSAGATSKINAIYAAANYWKHAEDLNRLSYPSTTRPLEDLGIDLYSTNCDETIYLVSNVFHRCGYSSLQEIIIDLKAWIKLVVEKTNLKI
jgi:hypothetical protein